MLNQRRDSKLNKKEEIRIYDRSTLVVTSEKARKRRKRTLSSLPSLLGANQRDNAAQFGTLSKLFLLCLFVDIHARCNVVADRQHTVLQAEQFGQRVVQEGRAKRNVGGRGAAVGDAQFEFPRWLSARVGLS